VRRVQVQKREEGKRGRGEEGKSGRAEERKRGREGEERTHLQTHKQSKPAQKTFQPLFVQPHRQDIIFPFYSLLGKRNNIVQETQPAHRGVDGG
jgi:hypothetical protein